MCIKLLVSKTIVNAIREGKEQVDTQRKRKLLVGFSVVTLILCGIVVLLIGATQVAAQNECGRDWYKLIVAAERDRCAQEKKARSDQRHLAERATAVARPRPPVPTDVDSNINGTPVDPGFIPEAAKKIEAVPVSDIIEIHGLRGVNNVWQIGALPGADPYDYSKVYLWARPSMDGQHARIGTFVFGSSTAAEQYMQVWQAPQDVGSITITDVRGALVDETGPVGIASFTTSTGQTGTLNLGNGVWQFTP